MNDFEKECKRCDVEKWKKALRIAEIRKETNCTYEQAEQIYNEEKEIQEKWHFGKFCVKRNPNR